MKAGNLVFAVFLAFCACVGSAAAVGGVFAQNGTLNATGNLYVGPAGSTLFVNATSGFVGIGTANSSRLLHIAAAQDANIRLQDTSGAAPGAYVEFYNDTTRWGYVGLGGHDDKMVVGTAIEKSLSFYTNDSPKMTLTAAGYVGIGTAGPSSLLHLYGTRPTLTLTTPGVASSGRIYQADTNSRIDISQNLYYDGSSYQRDDVSVGSAQLSMTSGDIRFRTAVAGANPATLSDRLFITNAGNVGIGTTSPGGNLEVRGNTTDVVFARIGNSNNGGSASVLDIWAGGSAFSIAQNATGFNSQAAPMVFAITGSEKMRITSGGNVGIGTTSPTGKLHVNCPDCWGGISDGVKFSAGNSDTLAIYSPSDNVKAIQTYIDGNTATLGPIALNPLGGNVGIGTTSPLANLHVNYLGNGNGYLKAVQGILIDNVENSGLSEGPGISFGHFSASTPEVVGRIATIRLGYPVMRMAIMFRNGGSGVGDFSASDERISILGNGNVGIGTTSPLAKLHVEGNTDVSAKILVRGTSGVNPTLELGSTEPGAVLESGEGMVIKYINNVGDTYFNNVFTGSTNAFHFQSGGTDRVTIQSGGNVGIGTTSPNQKLDVNGRLRLESVSGAGSVDLVVTTTGSPDTCNSACGGQPCLAAWTSAGGVSTCATSNTQGRCLCATFGS